ncbi:MAG: hypothetical protein D6796_13225, partial [Caldilineae bacterium]
MELYAMKPDGSRQTRLSDGSQKWGVETTPLTAYYRPYQVVIDHRYVFDLRSRQIVTELTSTQVVNGRPVKFTDVATDTLPFFVAFPVWSPSGEIVFFSSKTSLIHSLAIYYLKNAQSQPLRLTNPPDDVWGDGWPAWSPDGEWIVFDRNWDDSSQDGLWLIKSDGSQLHRIIQDFYNGVRRAAWSPDGTKLAYEGPKPNREHFSFELWVSDADGSNARQLTRLDSEMSVWGPAWSPDGKRIAFALQAAGLKTDIVIIYVESGEMQQLTTEGTYNVEPLWLPLDADEILAGGDTSLKI